MRKIILLLLLCILALSAWAAPIEASNEQHEYYYRAEVLEVKEHESQEEGGQVQEVTVKVKSGPFKDEIVNILNYYVPEQSFYDVPVKEGMEVILITFEEGDAVGDIYIHDVARDRGVYYLVALFAIALLLVGRMKGLKTLITLVVTITLVLTFFLPNLLQGNNPITLAVITSAITAIFTLVVIAGLNYKCLAAILGSMSGILVAGLLAMWVGNISHLTGFGSSEAQLLYYLEANNIDIRGILFAGIIIGSLGAVIDIGISVSSAAAEIKEANPTIKARELTASAMNVGRDVLGTMSNTLILAYVGAATPLLLLMTSIQTDWLKVINLDLIATELVRGIAGSIGLVVAVPVTALLSGYFMSNKEKGSGASRSA